MANDNLSRQPTDRFPIMLQAPFETSYFATRHGISVEQARHIINKYGHNRDKCDAAAELMK
jgi:hypothetical protein